MTMTEKRYRHFLRANSYDRAGLQRHVDHHALLAESIGPRATDKSRARHAMIARLAREELARRLEQESEARRVLRRITGERSHAPLYDILSGALALECDAVIENALDVWNASQHGYGTLPPLVAPRDRIGEVFQAASNALRRIGEEMAQLEACNEELSEQEKARLRARARRAQEQEMREEDAAPD